MSLTSWTRRERPGQWPLTGHRVSLEPLDWASHKAGLYEAVAAPAAADTWTYMPIGPFKDPEDFHETFDQIGADFGWETLVIRNRSNGKIAGMASFMRIREMHGSAEIGCVAFGHALRRTAEATEAMFLMAQASI